MFENLVPGVCCWLAAITSGGATVDSIVCDCPKTGYDVSVKRLKQLWKK